MAKNNSQYGGTVVSNPNILAGTPVIKNTRIPASLVIDLLRRGYPKDLILTEYPSLNKKTVDTFLSSVSKSLWNNK